MPLSNFLISIIGTVGVPACYGGFESLVENLLDYTPENVQYRVFCSAKKYSKKLSSYKGAQLVYLDREANGKESILYDYESMKRSLDCDVMLILGVSGCLFLPFIRRKFKGKIITNIDGLEWRRDKWKWYARLLLRFSERQAVLYSDVVIGDNVGIIEYVKGTYKKQATLIAYGGDHVHKVDDEAFETDYPFLLTKYAVSVCRIEPENNIHIILEAFKSSSLPLVVVGNWEDSGYGKHLKSEYKKYKNMHLLDPIYDSNRVNWIRSHAYIYIHGHSAGGTNPSLVEAMCLGLPIFAYDCIYNRSTTGNQCLYWKTAEDISLLLEKEQNELACVGKLMQEKGMSLYRWCTIAGQYNKLWK